MTQEKRIAALVFDLDGTLVDSLGDIAAAMNGALAAVGLPPHERERYRAWVGEGVGHLIRRVAPDRPDLFGAIEEAFRRRYAEDLVVETAPYPDVPELLDALAARRVPVAILSNKPDVLTRRVAREVLGRWRFAAVLGQRADLPRKPDPAGALAVAGELAVPPGHCALVGDTAVDMATARAAGMVALGVGWGFRPAELRDAGAAAVLARPLDVLAWLTAQPLEMTRI